MIKLFFEMLVAFAAVYGVYCAFYNIYLRISLEKKKGLMIFIDAEPEDDLFVRMYAARKIIGRGCFDGTAVYSDSEEVLSRVAERECAHTKKYLCTEFTGDESGKDE